MEPNGNLCEVILKWRLGGRPVGIVMHYKQDPTDVSPWVVTHSAEIRSSIVTNFELVEDWLDEALISPTLTINELGPSVFYPSPAPAPPALQRQVCRPIAQATPAISGGLIGLFGGDYLPSFNALKASKKTGVPRANYTGSLHLPGVPEGITTGQEVAPAFLADVKAGVEGFVLANILYTTMGDTYHLRPVVFSPTLVAATIVGGKISSDYCRYITSSQLNKVIGTMRRRKVRPAL